MSTAPGSTGYAYGDSEVAARRLACVATMFRDTTVAFLAESVRSAPGLAVDLGCGPGFTTRLIAETLQPARTVGLDRSEAFVERARDGAPRAVEFIRHDVTAVPLPVGPADLIYCRLLLSHLPDRPGMLARWATQLVPGGRLLVDEIEDVQTDDRTFVDYLELAQYRVAAGGGRLLVGAELEAAPDPPGLIRDSSRLAAFVPGDALAAEVFELNLQVLWNDPIVGARWSEDRLREMSNALARIEREGFAAPSTWRVRQIAWRRAPAQ